MATFDSSFTIPAATFRDLMEGALVASCRESSLSSINTVLIEWDMVKGTVVMVATDRYRLALGTATVATLPGNDRDLTGTGKALIDRKVAADIVRAIPKPGKRDAFVPKITFGSVLGGAWAVSYANALTGEEWTRHIPIMDGQFPKYETLVPTPEQLGKANGVTRFTCNPDYMADMSKLPHDKHVPVTWAFQESSRPAVGTYPVSTNGVAWQYLLMPVRLP